MLKIGRNKIAQQVLDGVLVAISSGEKNKENVSSLEVAKLLGIDKRRVLEAESWRKQVNSGVNIFTNLKTPNLRQDNINKEKRMTLKPALFGSKLGWRERKTPQTELDKEGGYVRAIYTIH